MRKILLNVREVINSNFLFMSIVAVVFGLFALFGGKGSSFNHYDFADIIFKGYVFIFIFFSIELSKNLLQKEKITKKTEWLIANGVSLHSICICHTVALFMATVCLLLPLMIISVIVLGKLSIVSLIEFYALSFLYSIITNVSILFVRDMNRFKNLSLLLSGIHLGVTLIEGAILLYINNTAATLVKFVAILLIVVVFSTFLTKERIASAYY